MRPQAIFWDYALGEPARLLKLAGRIDGDPDGSERFR
jgi:hypothetical protein